MTETNETALRWERRNRALAWVNTIAASILMLAVVVGANIIGNRYYLRRDITAEQSFRLNDHTVRVLEKLKKNVTVYLYELSQDPLGRRNVLLGNAWEKIRSLLFEYSVRSSAFVFKDLTEEEAQRLRSVDKEFPRLNPNDILFTCEGRKKVLNAGELYQEDPKTQRIAVFRAEDFFTTAIKELTAEERSIVYFSVGHGELDVNDQRAAAAPHLKWALTQRENCEVKTLQLGKEGRVPLDCALLCILGPQREVASDELENLKEYLERGGRLFLTVDPRYPGHGLGEFLAAWGVRTGQNMIWSGESFEQSQQIGVSFGVLSGAYPPGHPVNARMEELPTIYPYCATVDPLPSPETKIAAVPLVVSLPDSYAEGDLSFLEDPNRRPEWSRGERKGALPMVVAVESLPSASAEQSKRKSRMIVAGSTDFAAAYMSNRSYNMGYLLNCFRWLMEREREIAIPDKRFQQRPMELKPEEIAHIRLLSVFLFPLFGIVMGVIVWFFRRK